MMTDKDEILFVSGHMKTLLFYVPTLFVNLFNIIDQPADSADFNFNLVMW